MIYPLLSQDAELHKAEVFSAQQFRLTFFFAFESRLLEMQQDMK